MYNHGEIDKKWQDKWEAAGAFRAEDFSDKPKKYLLVEFPFPSGAGLHVGHPRSYTALDALARKLRMQGNNVLYPMGWDAFGLPTENFALKTGRPPAEVTAENVATFKRQIKSLGLSFDWSREVDSTDPGYYKWTQWQFLKFFQAGLAYKAKTWINWCPKDKIGLANEEAAGGVCDRCGGPVEKREKEQWMIGITKYADRLLSDLDQVNYLPKIRKQQEEWIGKSEGAEVMFDLVGIAGQNDGKHNVTVFTTRPDTLFGATYIAISAELAQSWINVGWQASAAVKNFVAETLADERAREATREDVIEKKGVATGIFAINPVNGEKIPVWVANYVLSGYGTGAIMAVPAHDERDFEFAKKFGLAIKQVVAPYIVSSQFAPRDDKETQSREVVTAIIRHKSTGKFLVQRMADGRCGFTGGGVEAGESSRDAVQREVAEETGFVEMEIVKQLGEICGHGFKPKKDINCLDPDVAFYIEVDGEPTQDRSEDDKIAHELVWKDEDDVRDFLNLSHHHFIWDWYKKGEYPFTEDGVATTTSGFLAGLKTEEAKQKMIAWLEENKVGTRKISYKLRDWVFSRQRYWGEPIPLVHCTACAEKKQKVLYVHGFNSSGSKNEPMRARLEALGFEVLLPTMSTSAAPDFEKWMEELRPYFDKLGEDDIVIGHSLGGHAAVNALARAHKKIKALILVAPAIGTFPPGYWEKRKAEKTENVAAIEKLEHFIAQPVDIAKAGELATAKEVVWSDDDTRVPEPTHQLYRAGWYINRVTGHDHFWGVAGVDFFVETIAKYKNTGWVPVPESDLPLTLPQVAKYEPTDTGESPLASIPEFVHTKCPRCGGVATRETDTMPNWAGSSWYFLRYCDAHNEKEFAAADKLKYWMPVDLYNGGMEHTVLHLLYSRFWNKFMYDLGYVPTAEPYARRVSHGLIMAEDGQKMSKSKGNVVNPDEIVQQQGADTLRVYEMFIGPFSEAAPWSTNGVSGVKRFLDRVMRLGEKIAPQESEAVTRGLHKMLKAVTEDYDRMSFNTAVAQYMTFVNTVYSEGAITHESLQTFLRALNVAAPHVSEELWEKIGGNGLVCQQQWPSYNETLVRAETYELVVQVNGKVRDRIMVAMDTSEEEARALALQSEKVREWIGDKTPLKVVVIKNKLVSIAV